MIRRYRDGDRSGVYDVCVRTALAGGDARGRYVSDELPGDIWAGPYLALEPELAFVVTTTADGEERVAGYVLGTADTRAFVERYRAEWLPRFATRYPVVDDDTWAGHHPERMLVPGVDEYPAHLHIDLLPELQRQGWGRALMRRFLAAAAERGADGAHLGFDPANTGAAAFYERIGFRPMPASRAEAPLYGFRGAMP